MVYLLREFYHFTFRLMHNVNMMWPAGFKKNAYELFLRVNKIHNLPCIVKIFCVEFQRVLLKVHTKYLSMYIIFLQCV